MPIPRIGEQKPQRPAETLHLALEALDTAAVETITEDLFPEQAAVSRGHSGQRGVLWILHAVGRVFLTF